MRTICNFLLCVPVLAGIANAATLTRSTITEVVKDVSVIKSATKAQKAAQVRDVFATPDILRTGVGSRAELVAEDQTVTRVGANSLFSFEPEKREINLQRGSVLFNSPTGKGGGTIKTAAATASVLGTTLIVVTTWNGGFKVLMLEGRGKVTPQRGRSRTLTAGQMTFILPGQGIGPVYNFQLREQVVASRLVGGFKRTLPSMPKIAAAVERQSAQIAKGQLVKTGLLASDSPDFAYQVDANAREALLEEGQPQTVADIVDEVASSPFGLAISSDAVIDAPQLDPARLFGTADGGALGSGNAGTFFVARNTLVTTPTIDLSAFAVEPLLEFLSFGDLTFDASVDLLGAPTTQLRLVVAGTIINSPGTLVRVNNPRTDVLAFGSSLDFQPGAASPGGFRDGQPLELTDFAMINLGGDMTVFGPSISLQNAGLLARGDLRISTPGSIEVQDNITALRSFNPPPGTGQPPAPRVQADTSFSPAGTPLAAGGLLSLDAGREFSAERTDFVADRIRVDAGSEVRINLARLSNRDFDSKRGFVGLRAGDTINVGNAIFQVNAVAMQARTINLRNVAFAGGSSVVLDSQTGRLAPQPNTGQPSRPGFVNFIRNVRYGGQPAQGFVGQGIAIR